MKVSVAMKSFQILSESYFIAFICIKYLSSFHSITNIIEECQINCPFRLLINLHQKRKHKILLILPIMEPNPSPPVASNPSLIPQRTRFDFSQPREPHIFFDSTFDSGNMSEVKRTAYDHYSIWTACDAQGTANEGYPKSWFYFEVGGFINRRISFSVHRVHFLYAMCKHPEAYRPVYRIKYEHGEVSEWDRLPYEITSLTINSEEELVLRFDFLFNKLIASVEFAFIYPYSYEQCRKDLLKLEGDFEWDRELFLARYELTRSYEQRVIDMLIISSHEGREGFEVTKGLPFSDQKIAKFRSNKPIIFISARVHPIETPSSFTMNGIISFLLDKQDTRAYLLRKYFVFVLVPMLNPDGVSRGHCRMDSLNQNLNRYYSTPDPEKQPSCFAVRKLCEHYSKDKRLFMYLDLHAHPAYKGNFTFGNAIYEFIQQVESQLFPKVLSQNCINFEFEQCIFSRKHMKAKDRNEDVSKEGCGRVVFYKDFGLVHSYTLECGYHINSFNNELQEEKNISQRFLVKYRLTEKGEKIYEGEKVIEKEQVERFLQEVPEEEGKGWDIYEHTRSCLDNKEDAYYKRELPTYSIDTFLNLGRNILISILDIWNKNPYSRLEDMNADRKEIAEKQSKLDRFRKEQTGIKAKQKKIVELIEEQFYGEWHKRNIFNFNFAATQNRDKKRNLTLQFNKVQPSGGLGQKHEKSQKIVPSKQEEEGELTQSKQFEGMMKDPKSFTGSESVLDHRGFYSRNFKVSRGKQTSSAVQPGEKEKGENKCASINKEILAAQIRLTLEEEVSRVSRQDGLAISSKVIKGGLGSIRMRNIGLAPSRK